MPLIVVPGVALA
jgi:hypothetical protein